MLLPHASPPVEPYPPTWHAEGLGLSGSYSAPYTSQPQWMSSAPSWSKTDDDHSAFRAAVAFRQMQPARPGTFRSDSAFSTDSSVEYPSQPLGATSLGWSTPHIAGPAASAPPQGRLVSTYGGGTRAASMPSSPEPDAPSPHSFELRMPIRNRRRSSSSTGQASSAASPVPGFAAAGPASLHHVLVPERQSSLMQRHKPFSLAPTTQMPSLHFDYTPGAIAARSASSTSLPIVPAQPEAPVMKTTRSASFDAAMSPEQREKLSSRPHKCDECPQAFNRRHDLRRHQRIHMTVKPFPCGWCDKQFSRKDALKRHLLVKLCGEGEGQTKELSEQGISVAPSLQNAEAESPAAMSPQPMSPPDPRQPGPIDLHPPFLGQVQAADYSSGSGATSAGTGIGSSGQGSTSTMATSLHSSYDLSPVPQVFDYGVSYTQRPPGHDPDRTLMPRLKSPAPDGAGFDSSAYLPHSPGSHDLSIGPLHLGEYSPAGLSSADAYAPFLNASPMPSPRPSEYHQPP